MFTKSAGSNRTFRIQMTALLAATNTEDSFFRDIEAKKGVPSLSNCCSLRQCIDILHIGWAQITSVSTERYLFFTHRPTDTFVSSFVSDHCHSENRDRYDNRLFRHKSDSAISPVVL